MFKNLSGGFASDFMKPIIGGWSECDGTSPSENDSFLNVNDVLEAVQDPPETSNEGLDTSLGRPVPDPEGSFSSPKGPYMLGAVDYAATPQRSLSPRLGQYSGSGFHQNVEGNFLQAASPSSSLWSRMSERNIPVGRQSCWDSRGCSPDSFSTSNGNSCGSSLGYLSEMMDNLSFGSLIGTQSPSRSPLNLSASPILSPLSHSQSPSGSQRFFGDCESLSGNRWNIGVWNSLMDHASVETVAKLHRNSATLCDANCTWSGVLPSKTYKNPTYSCKLFLGGVPWDVTEMELVEAFSPFGAIKVQWPGRDVNSCNPQQKAGYVYIIFESEKQVRVLLNACSQDSTDGTKWYYTIYSRRLKSKEVQVIPWVIGENKYVRCPSQPLDSNKTVFVGALHGMMTAEGLAHVMNELFGGVVYAGIDTDKYKYPIGSGRVTFNNHKSFMKAVSAAFVEIKAQRFKKIIQVDPYLEDSMCSNCQIQRSTIFCRSLECFRYFCHTCWQWQHASLSPREHKPLMRS